jgi:hypothetical protein
MPIKKIKISELPLGTTISNLYTIGSYALNQSVKVSVEWIKNIAVEEVRGSIAFSEANTKTNINSGDSLPTIFGKLKKWFSSFGTFAWKSRADYLTELDNIPVNVTQTKDGLMSKEDKIRLDGVATGAEVNVQSDWNQTNNTADDFIKNKPVNATQTVDGFMSKEDKIRLDGVIGSSEVAGSPYASYADFLLGAGTTITPGKYAYVTFTDTDTYPSGGNWDRIAIGETWRLDCSDTAWVATSNMTAATTANVLDQSATDALKTAGSDTVTSWLQSFRNNLKSLFASVTSLVDGKQDKITSTGTANLLTAPSVVGGNPGTKAVSDFLAASSVTDNLSSTSTADALSANQGRILDSKKLNTDDLYQPAVDVDVTGAQLQSYINSLKKVLKGNVSIFVSDSPPSGSTINISGFSAVGDYYIDVKLEEETDTAVNWIICNNTCVVEFSPTSSDDYCVYNGIVRVINSIVNLGRPRVEPQYNSAKIHVENGGEVIISGTSNSPATINDVYLERGGMITLRGRFNRIGTATSSNSGFINLDVTFVGGFTSIAQGITVFDGRDKMLDINTYNPVISAGVGRVRTFTHTHWGSGAAIYTFTFNANALFNISGCGRVISGSPQLYRWVDNGSASQGYCTYSVALGSEGGETTVTMTLSGNAANSATWTTLITAAFLSEVTATKN